MKTKIIYISGNELFEMAQIRAAFEEVRSTLGLGNDTVLFGVPVDADNALENTVTETVNSAVLDKIVETPEIKTEETNEPPVIEPEMKIIPEILTTENEPEVETVPESETADAEPEKIIPILSILSANDTDDEPVQAIEETDTEPEPEPIPEPENTPTDTLAVSIDDVVVDDVPVMEHKKTLEELLESMEPLGEDVMPEPVSDIESEPELDTADPQDFSISMTDDVADTDATLAQLANEFAQAQDKIPESPKPSGNGKIGKLKNILPFKKAKRDDSGIMGDLFGWAGIAANDEDFSIPGFFTGVAGQK